MIAIWLALACGTSDDTDPSLDDTDRVVAPDVDGDGFGSDVDCDDDNDAIRPDATEVCDFVDNDCDQLVDGDDPDLPPQGFRDADGDKYPGTPSYTCGDTGAKTDCDDADPSVHPGAIEGECDGIDQNCDGNGSEVALYAGVPYPSLRQAVWDAKDGVDPIVYACPGVHLENDVIYDGHGVTIEGYTKNADDVVFDAQGGTGILSATGPVVVKYVTFKNGGNGGRVPACLYAIGGSLEVAFAKFEGCTTAISAADGTDSDDLHLSQVSITGGYSSTRPAAVSLKSDSGKIILDGVSVTDASSAMSPVTLTVGGDGRVEINGGTYTANTSAKNGGAIEVITDDGDPSVRIDGATFEDNQAAETGGAFALSMGKGARPDLFIDNSHFSWNTAQSGGAIGIDIDRRIAGIDLWVEDSDLSGNEATQHGGGIGIYSWNGTLEDDTAEVDLTLRSLMFSLNQAGESGAAVGVGVGPGSIVVDSVFMNDNLGDVGIFVVDDGPYDLTLIDGTARRNQGGARGVFDFKLVDESNTATFSNLRFGADADANTSYDLADCTSRAHLGLVTAKVNAASPCP